MLKKSLTFALFAVLLIGSAAAEDFVIDNISFSQPSTPAVRYANNDSRVRVGSKNRWLRLQVDFVPAAKKRGDAWYDDVTMEGLLLLSRGKQDSATSYVVLTGETRFFTIPADKKKHFGVFFVPPMLLARYCDEPQSAPKAVRLIRVAFYGPGRVLLGEGYWVAAGKKGRFVSPENKMYKTVAAQVKELEKPKRNVTFLRGGLYSKEMTPWNYLDYDAYDLIYENVRLQAGESIQK